MKKRPLESIYIHIPFCREKCHYCAFLSYANKESFFEDYVDALTQETSKILERYKDINIRTIYAGGGTPSLLDIKYYKKIFKNINNYINIDAQAEITIEINPGTVDFAYLNELKSIGFNRLSVGVQSFERYILDYINRKHNIKDVYNAIDNARKSGFENISIDLIYGLPYQTMKVWQDSLASALKLDIDHISTYGLKIEKGTKFYKQYPEKLPADEVNAQMYLECRDFLTQNGFNHYEISNFAKDGFESKHNLSYWHNKEYFGFGTAAHGYVNKIRYSNQTSLEDYIKNPFIKKEFYEELSNTDIVKDAIILGLRTTNGLSLNEFKTDYDFDLIKHYKTIINKYTAYKLLILEDNRLKLTPKGFLLSNNVLSDFL